MYERRMPSAISNGEGTQATLLTNACSIYFGRLAHIGKVTDKKWQPKAEEPEPDEVNEANEANETNDTEEKEEEDPNSQGHQTDQTDHRMQQPEPGFIQV
jgi:hypothetical protein